MAKPPLRVLLVASESIPFAKSGGLADMVGSLAPALRRRGVDARLVLPRYGAISTDGLQRHPAPLQVPLDGEGRWCAVLETEHDGVPVYLLEHDVLYDRPFLYGPPGRDYEDNCLRFALLSRAALQLCQHLDWCPHVFHAHEWQGALVPVYLDAVAQHTHLGGTATVLTLHNMAHQGWFVGRSGAQLGLGTIPLDHLGLQTHGAINLLRGGLLHATLLTTVSPTYAREIQTPAYGEGLDAVLRERRGDLFGVLNGVDQRVWDPATDPCIPAHYSAQDLSGKRACKAALQRELGLPEQPATPLVGFIGRLTTQKGVDLIAAALDRLFALDLQLVLLGVGEPWAEDFFRAAAERYPQRLATCIAFDEPLAHRIQAGCDLLLMPSRWEPCGLNQMYAQRYGTLPVVRSTGGLHDTVVNFDGAREGGTGFVFADATVDALLGTVAWAVQIYRESRPAFEATIQRAMAQRRDWDRAAAHYEYLYRLAMVRRRGG